MIHDRHSNENRVRPGSTPTKTLRLVEWYRRMATRRKLILLECGIIRYAPFADCGRPLWELMTDQRWFEEIIPSAEWLRFWKANHQAPEFPPDAEWVWMRYRTNGHRVIRWFEQDADAPDADRLILIEEYCRRVEWSAEADRFNTPDERRDELEISYGAAYWLYDLQGFGQEQWNVLDYYLGNYSKMFYCWSVWRPLHPDHQSVAISLIDDIFWHPSRSFRFDASWRSANAIEIAKSMYETRDFSSAPILADALEEAGCDNKDILTHCRSERKHCRGCWVVDRVLGIS